MSQMINHFYFRIKFIIGINFIKYLILALHKNIKFNSIIIQHEVHIYMLMWSH